MKKTPQEVVQDVKKRGMFSLGTHGAYILAKPIVEKQATVIIVTNENLARQLQNSSFLRQDTPSYCFNQEGLLTV